MKATETEASSGQAQSYHKREGTDSLEAFPAGLASPSQNKPPHAEVDLPDDICVIYQLRAALTIALA